MRDARHIVAIKVIDAIEAKGYQAMLAGGCVRDRLMGIAPKDYDVATSAVPPEVISIFRGAGIKVVPTGIDHGTVTVIINKVPIEVTTLRQDIETHGRHATVAFGADFRTDAMRRDFTINAMFEARDGTIVDYFGGQEDIAHKRLRFVGDASERIAEDYLRILRFYRFWARFAFAGDPAGIEATRQHRDGLRQISQERITSEIRQIFCGKAIDEVGPILARMQILAIVFPEWTDAYGNDAWRALARADATVWQEDLFPVRMSLLAYGQPAGVNRVGLSAILKRLRLSNREQEQITTLIGTADHLATMDESAEPAAYMAVADQITRVFHSNKVVEAACKDIWPHMVPTAKPTIDRLCDIETNQGSIRTAPPLISGDELMERLGMTAGPQLGKLLEAIKREQRNGKLATKEEALALAPRLQDEPIK